MSVRGADTRRIETVGPGLGVGREPPDGFGQIGPADQKPLRTPGEENAGAALVDRPASRPDPLDREGEVVERPVGIAGGIFDGESRDSGGAGGGDVGRDRFRLAGKSSLGIRR